MQTFRNSHFPGGNANLVQPLHKTICQFLIKLKIQFPYDPVIPPLGIYSRQMKTMFTQTPKHERYSRFIIFQKL